METLKMTAGENASHEGTKQDHSRTTAAEFRSKVTQMKNWKPARSPSVSVIYANRTRNLLLFLYILNCLKLELITIRTECIES